MLCHCFIFSSVINLNLIANCVSLWASKYNVYFYKNSGMSQQIKLIRRISIEKRIKNYNQQLLLHTVSKTKLLWMFLPAKLIRWLFLCLHSLISYAGHQMIGTRVSCKCVYVSFVSVCEGLWFEPMYLFKFVDLFYVKQLHQHPFARVW